ncbi:MAG: hypothetical protein WC580_10115, partial [Agrococcus sp.]
GSRLSRKSDDHETVETILDHDHATATSDLNVEPLRARSALSVSKPPCRPVACPPSENSPDQFRESTCIPIRARYTFSPANSRTSRKEELVFMTLKTQATGALLPGGIR